VVGEISRATLAASGHWYFVLKDEGAAIDCAMFKGRAQYLDFKPENGLRVEVRARVTVYEARGAYQLAVEQMRHAGLGALFEAFEKLKARLGKEGLFEPARKRSLPAFARAIGVVTSPAAAALHDILTTLARRAPMIPVILYPTAVQGEGAAAQVARAIETANARGECDVLLVARGGGSLEDLWAFNEEVVARAIFECTLPIISGILTCKSSVVTPPDAGITVSATLVGAPPSAPPAKRKTVNASLLPSGDKARNPMSRRSAIRRISCSLPVSRSRTTILEITPGRLLFVA